MNLKMKKKMFKTAPLPFQGQKRRFAGGFAAALTELKEKKDVKVVVDLFGGSGLLAHIAKSVVPGAKVIYNDFDNYSQRLLHVNKTNKLLSDIRTILDGTARNKERISANKKTAIIDRIAQEHGYVDYVTLSGSLLFSGKYLMSLEEFKKEHFYNKVKVSDYDFDPADYLDGLEVVSIDYKQLYNLYKDVEGVLFVVDPPYLSTDTSSYNSDKYWKLRDYLDVLNVLVDTNYIFFTSNKSSLVELCEWLDDHKGFSNPFAQSVLNTKNVTINKSASYQDMMLYRFVE